METKSFEMENIEEHYAKSLARLTDDFYALDRVYKEYGGEKGYDWPGDYEGRYLLALVCLEKVTGRKIPRLQEFMVMLDGKLNEKGYFGLIDTSIADEQALFGHNWVLRGLLKYYEVYGDKTALEKAKRVVDNFYMVFAPAYEYYPETPREKLGGTAGNVLKEENGWKLSTDVGAAFAPIDGLAHYYAITKDENVLRLLNKLIATFMRLDKQVLRLQTHTTLTVARGIFTLYQATEDTKYYDMAKEIYDLYLNVAFTYTYENYNWFTQKDSWTEPCAVVDSLILALSFYRETGEKEFKTLARRIWFNGLRFAHRDNGGAGTASCVHASNNKYKMMMYEAHFCCTMRYCEGLEWIFDNKELFVWQNKAVETDELGRRFIDDCLLVEKDGERILMPTLLYTPKEEAQKLEFRIF